MIPIKAILIDPFACTVTEVEVDANDHHSYYPLLSHPTMPVDLFTTARPGILRGNDALFVDDEGLMKEPDRFFIIASGDQPYAGKGLIVGATAGGDCKSAETSLTVARLSVMFAEVVHRCGKDVLAHTNKPWVAPDDPGARARTSQPDTGGAS